MKEICPEIDERDTRVLALISYPPAHQNLFSNNILKTGNAMRHGMRGHAVGLELQFTSKGCYLKKLREESQQHDRLDELITSEGHREPRNGK